MPFDPKPVMIMAGGTGGHVYPALAVADYLHARGVPLFWLGTRLGLEYSVVPARGIRLFTIRVGGLRGKGPVRWLLAPLGLVVALFQSLRILLRCRPGVVLGMGGFVSGPGGVAAWLLRIPLYIHEQNAIAGFTNRLLYPLAARVMQGFPGTFKGNKVTTTGNPVRRDILAVAPPAQRLSQHSGQPLHLLVLGGSLGARILNETIPQALAQLPPDLAVTVRHQTGRDHCESTRRDYADLGLEADGVVPYMDDMAGAYGWADLILCRAGALTISEICSTGIAAILVPYPHAVDDHQTANARYLSGTGAAVLLPQADLDAAGLAALLTELAGDRERLLAMAEQARRQARPDATADVGGVCMEAACA